MTPRSRYSVPLPDGRTLALGERTLVMGVLNVTPDSFSDGGQFLEPQAALDAGLALIDAGADIVDVGGESSRPGALPVSLDEECRRVVPVVEALAARGHVPIAVDTTKAEVARRALDGGAAIVNDISALTHDPSLAPLVAERRAAVVLMHMRGTPQTMTERAHYAELVTEVAEELADSIGRARQAGIAEAAIIVDPGLGFAKRARHSVDLLAALDAGAILRLGRPLLVGPSRKSFLEQALGPCDPSGRDWGTAAAVTAAVGFGAHIVRVHRVREMVQVVRVADMIRGARERQWAARS